MLFVLNLDSGNTAWLIVATCLVFIMTPGLAMFYGGLLRKKNVIAMFGLCLSALFIVSIAWWALGYSIAFGPDIDHFIGNLTDAGLADLNDVNNLFQDLPTSVYILFECMFAVITAAILASPFTDRVRFGRWCLFILIWILVVYSPIAHWVWTPSGWLASLGTLTGGTGGALDFAGGSVVHVDVGMSALAVALVIGPRKDFGKASTRPNNIPLVMIGLGLLWIGWFGFNGGSSLGANAQGGLALLNTNLAACAAAITWAILEYFDKEKGRSSLIGMGTGVLAGLVGITPAAGFVLPWAAVLIGIITPFPCYFALKWRGKSKIDESLDAFACHGVGGMTGAFLTGIFASVFGAAGLITGNYIQVLYQIIDIVAVAAYAFVMTYAIAWIIKKTIGLRATPDEEMVGMDLSQHNEIAYEL